MLRKRQEEDKRSKYVASFKMASPCDCCGKRIREIDAKLATMNVKYCMTAAAAMAAREQQRFCTPKYTMASSNVGTETTQTGWKVWLSCCIYELSQTAGRLQQRWELAKVGDKWKVVEAKKTLNVESGVAKTVAACDEAGGESVECHDNEAGPSGINAVALVSASMEVEGTGFVNGRPVINRLYIERLFADSDDSDDDWWDPDEGFHDGKNS